MILKLHFGMVKIPVSIDWDKPLTDFPKVVNYNHRNWEWNMYTSVNTPPPDYELMFGELKTYDPRALEAHPTLAMITAGVLKVVCDCGADKDPNAGGHWKFCKLWGK